MENFISPLYFKESNYVIRLFSNNRYKIFQHQFAQILVPFPRLWNFNFSCLLRFVPYNWVPLLCYCHFKELATVFLWCQSFNFRFPLFKSRYATLHPAMLVGRSVGRSVSWSVGLSVGWSVGPLLYFWAFLSFLRLLLLPRCPCNLLQQCSCLPTCDWSSRVSGLVFIEMF